MSEESQLKAPFIFFEAQHPEQGGAGGLILWKVGVLFCFMNLLIECLAVCHCACENGSQVELT